MLEHYIRDKIGQRDIVNNCKIGIKVKYYKTYSFKNSLIVSRYVINNPNYVLIKLFT